MKTEVIDLVADIFVDLTADPLMIDLTLDDSDSDLEISTKYNKYVLVILDEATISNVCSSHHDSGPSSSILPAIVGHRRVS